MWWRSKRGAPTTTSTSTCGLPDTKDGGGSIGLIPHDDHLRSAVYIIQKASIWTSISRLYFYLITLLNIYLLKEYLKLYYLFPNKEYVLKECYVLLPTNFFLGHAVVHILNFLQYSNLLVLFDNVGYHHIQ